MNRSITAHTLVKNEEKYVWFSVMSVIDFVDKFFIWDTGSTDKTVEIIKAIKREYPSKVYFKEVGEVDLNKFTSIRQTMLDETNSDWFILVDGDEVWWEDSIKKVVDIINEKGDSLDSMVNSYYNIVGDIYHYQEKEAGQYNIDDRRGHFNIRATNRKIPGLHFENPHGQLALVDENGISVQNRDKKRRTHLDISYLHFTNVYRSNSRNLFVPKRRQKLKYEIGNLFPRDFYYPEVFFRKRPDTVPYPWQKMSYAFYSRALLETPLRKIKRRIIKVRSSGY